MLSTCICVCLEVSDPVSGLSSSLLHTEQTVSGRQSSSCIFAAKGNIPSWRELWIMKRGCCLFRQHKPDLLGEITCFTSLKHLRPSEGWRSSSANVPRISAGRLFKIFLWLKLFQINLPHRFTQTSCGCNVFWSIFCSPGCSIVVCVPFWWRSSPRWTQVKHGGFWNTPQLFAYF